jgi:1-acyl-sn-glycerol-3-phosphate acyltransferase
MSLRAAVRVVRVLRHVLGGYITIKRHFGAASLSERQAHVQRWAAGFCDILGVVLKVQGNPTPQRPAATDGAAPGLLLVANHISWLDILVLLAVRPVRFVSKSEVAHWPILGNMATGAGTLYIERAKKRDALRVMHVMAMTAGDCVGVFPEGTTGDGSGLLPFHANLFQAAISSNAAALPVVMSFVEPGTSRLSQAASYVDDDNLVSSVWRLLNSPGIEVRMNFMPPQAPPGADRRAWANSLHAQMVSAHASLLA